MVHPHPQVIDVSLAPALTLRACIVGGKFVDSSLSVIYMQGNQSLRLQYLSYGSKGCKAVQYRQTGVGERLEWWGTMG